jgi:predicted AlkP superfamily phosphohydrolase/phosphomutase
VGDEQVRQFRHVLGEFESGLLFYYFGSLDQVSHMMWRPLDAGHPAYDEATDRPYQHVVEDHYVAFDRLVGDTLTAMPQDALLVVMSDHGFSSWRRVFNLNAWLEQRGWLAVVDETRREADVLSNVDWSRTRAYGLGFNSLYLNLQGREKWGGVRPADREGLLSEIGRQLLQVRDPVTGEPAVTSVFRREEAYGDTPHAGIAPDLVIGYAKGTRVSNESALGAVPAEVFGDNGDWWSGDHCMDPDAVPGLLLVNRGLRTPVSSLQELSTAILAEFDVSRSVRGR